MPREELPIHFAAPEQNGRGVFEFSIACEPDHGAIAAAQPLRCPREPRRVHLLGGEVIADPWMVFVIAEHHPQHADHRIIIEKQDARCHHSANLRSVDSKVYSPRERAPLVHLGAHELPTSSAPCTSMSSRSSGSLRILAISWPSRATISFGVLAGANSPYHS